MNARQRITRLRRCSAQGRAFTLLEVLVSLAILTVGSTCIVALFSAGLETYRRSNLEQLATNLGVELLDTAEDALGGGIPPEKLQEKLDERIVVPPTFSYELASEERTDGSVTLSVKITSGGRGRTRQWQWRRTVVRATGAVLLPLERRAPQRYRDRGARR